MDSAQRENFAQLPPLEQHYCGAGDRDRKLGLCEWGGGVTLCHTETLCNTQILCNTGCDLGRMSCNTLSSCRLFLAETDTAGDSSDILTTKQEAQFQSGLKSW